MRLLFTLVFLLQTFVSFGVDFTKLSREEPITTVYPANFKCYVDVSLFVDATEAYKGAIFLRVSYIIGNDTLNDNINMNGSHNAVIKQLFLDEGERLTVVVRLNNGEIEEINGLKGSLGVVRNPEFKPAEAEGKNSFLSGVWKSDQTPLFRVRKDDSTPKIFRLKLTMNENYEFDKFFFKMKVISPSAGILMLEKEVGINDLPALKLRKKTFAIDIDEVDLTTPGTYYFQAMHNMMRIRINGVDRIDYEIVPQ